MILPDGRARLGLGAQVKVQSRGDRGGVFLCPYCDAVIGEHSGGYGKATILREQHDAPCGLRCAGSASRFWAEAMHTGPNTCVRCIPVACPTCDGRKAYARSAHSAAQLTGDPAIVELARRDPGARVSVKCASCKGTGVVPYYRVKKFD